MNAQEVWRRKEIFDLIYSSGGTWMGLTMKQHVAYVRSLLSPEALANVSEKETLGFFRMLGCRLGFGNLYSATALRCERLSKLRRFSK